MIDRRTFLAASAAAFAAGCHAAAPKKEPAPERAKPLESPERFEAIRATLGAGSRIGVAAIDTGTGRMLLHDADSRYAMASTFKLALAAAVLAEAEKGRFRLSDELPLDPGPPLDNSPVTSAHMKQGRLSIEKIAAAIVRVSDNSGANLLLRKIGGPQRFTAFLRSCGDEVTRLDRYEMELNSNLPRDPRDTTSPRAMAELTRTLVLGDRLTPASRARLIEWMKTSLPGPDRLRAGIPAAWEFGHKTGTGARGAVNDVGIAWPPERAPIVIASYQSGGGTDRAVQAAAHASVARLVAEAFA